jgi:clathrin heavy chain
LACVAYKRGHCDKELIECTNKNSLFKLQARYLVERQDMDTYAMVLADDNEHRKAVIEQLVNTALPESKHPEMVSCCVKAFMAAGLQAELIKLLEMIVLQDSAFSSNQNLQNLLIITALKSAPDRVPDYIHRLEGFEPKAVAQVALDHEQHDTAFEIYRKGGHKVEALTVLTDRVRDLNRAHEYATKVDDPSTWSTLGHKQLEQGHVTDSIGSYILAKDSSRYMEVTAKAKEVKQYDDLVKYLMMVRDKVKDPKVDTEIVIGYAMTDKLGDLEAFITSAILMSSCAAATHTRRI